MCHPGDYYCGPQDQQVNIKKVATPTRTASKMCPDQHVSSKMSIKDDKSAASPASMAAKSEAESMVTQAPSSNAAAEAGRTLLKASLNVESASAKTGWLLKPSGYFKAKFQQRHFRIVEEEGEKKLVFVTGGLRSEQKRISLLDCVNCVSEGCSVLLEFRTPVKVSHTIQHTVLELISYDADDAEEWAEAIRCVSPAEANYPDPATVSSVRQQVKCKDQVFHTSSQVGFWRGIHITLPSMTVLN